MSPLVTDQSWTRQGMSLVWSRDAFPAAVDPAAAWSLRQLLRNQQAWPDKLPLFNARAAVVAGLEAFVDALGPNDAEAWLEEVLAPALYGFQDEYQGQGALIFWVPGANTRHEHSADDRYCWRWGGAYADNSPLELGRCLWGGAERSARRIVASSKAKGDTADRSWVGLHLVRLS